MTAQRPRSPPSNVYAGLDPPAPHLTQAQSNKHRALPKPSHASPTEQFSNRSHDVVRRDIAQRLTPRSAYLLSAKSKANAMLVRFNAQIVNVRKLDQSRTIGSLDLDPVRFDRVESF